ncbi:class I SAM-dependent methyltransferase [Roseateles sp.]|uniref:class I SAM-dependent methyltransferase n=1 Tax=Roseateles sp. TaxID=1971397 RepID=UPI00393A600D
MTAPSRWLQDHLPPERGSCLDLACGSGRNLRWLAAQGWRVTGVDRDAEAIGSLRAVAEVIEADIEAGPWPLTDRTFDLVLVCNYLWRPLLDTVLASVAPGGSLIYETFANGQQCIGRPSRPDFLLQRAELLAHSRGWELIAFEDLFEPAGPDGVNARFVQRVAARRPQL